MKALDTNVVVRLLIEGDPRQHRRALQALTEAQREGEQLMVTDLVLLEMCWVLSTTYQMSRAAILDAIEQLLNLSVLVFQSPSNVRQFIIDGRDSSFDLADLLIGLNAREAGCATTLTFDRHAARSAMFTEL